MNVCRFFLIVILLFSGASIFASGNIWTNAVKQVVMIDQQAQQYKTAHGYVTKGFLGAAGAGASMIICGPNPSNALACGGSLAVILCGHCSMKKLQYDTKKIDDVHPGYGAALAHQINLVMKR